MLEPMKPDDFGIRVQRECEWRRPLACLSVILVSAAVCTAAAVAIRDDVDTRTYPRSHCSSEPLHLTHKGNTFTKVKYAMHCPSHADLEKTLIILSAIGFNVTASEGPPVYHTFVYPPKSFGLDSDAFMFILIVADDGNHQKVNTLTGRQGPHVGFKLPSTQLLNRTKAATCSMTQTLQVCKPDEVSLFVEVPCGEELEFSAQHDGWSGDLCN